MQKNLQADYNKLNQLESDAKQYFVAYEGYLKAEHKAVLAAHEAEYLTQQEMLKNQYKADLAQLEGQLQANLKQLQYLAAPWQMEAWLGFEEGIAAETYRDSLRVGYIKRQFKNTTIEEIPMLLPFINKNHVLLISYGEARVRARLVLQSLVLRALTIFNDSETEFILIDPLGMGANLPFQAVSPKLRGEMIYAEDDEINAQLRRLTDQIRSGKQEKRYILVASDFPSRFTEDALNRLSVIAQQGISNNIYLILHVDSNIPLPLGFEPSGLLQTSSKIYLTSDEQIARVEGEVYPFIPDTAPDAALFDMLLRHLAAS